MKIQWYLAVLIVVFCTSANVVYATVGGPTVVYDLKFDTTTATLYYVEHNSNGRGCPPELKAISVRSGTSKTLFSCDDFESQSDHDYQKQAEEINTYTVDFRNLTPLSLKKNEISAEIRVEGVEHFEDDPEFITKTNFTARIFQGGVQKATIPFSGCSVEQPLVIDGYSIPGEREKLVLLFSTKSDCFEGGYIGETVHLVSGLNVLDDSPVGNAYKSNTPLVPHEGSVVVYHGVEQGAAPVVPPSTSTEGSFKMLTLGLCALIVFVCGLVLGRLIKVTS